MPWSVYLEQKCFQLSFELSVADGLSHVAHLQIRHWHLPSRAVGKSSESVQCAMLKACDACADIGQL